MSILTDLDFQIAGFRYYLETDEAKDELIYFYFISEREGKLLDVNKLQTYLSKNKIKNLALLKNISENSENIFDLWNNDLSKNLDKIKKLEKPFYYQFKNEDFETSANMKDDFRVLVILENSDWKPYTNYNGKKYILENFRTIKLSLQKIIVIIREIHSVINQYYPDISEPIKEPQKPEAIKPDDVKKELHNHIFIDNAFEVWEQYFLNKQVTVSSRTDLRLIFELMKIDNLILDTIDLKHYINWINKVYFDFGITELKNIDLQTKPNIQRENDYKEYKRATLKKP